MTILEINKRYWSLIDYFINDKIKSYDIDSTCYLCGEYFKVRKAISFENENNERVYYFSAADNGYISYIFGKHIEFSLISLHVIAHKECLEVSKVVPDFAVKIQNDYI